MTVNTLGSHDSRRTRTVAEWLWPFVPMAVSVFSGSALVYYHLYQHVIEAHSPLQQLYAAIYRWIGFAPAVMFFGLTMVWSTIWLAVGRLDRPGARLVRLLAMAVMLGVFLNLGDGGVSPEVHKGALGAWLARTLVAVGGYWPSLLLVWGVTFASLLLATDFFFYDSFEKLRTPAPPRETGVEPAVTDHFRALAEASPAPAPASAPAAPPAATAPENASPIDVAVDEPAAVELPRRRTYAERRAARSARGWRGDSEETWVPGSPESQDIEDPEHGAVAANASAAAAAEAPAAPATEDDLLVLPPLADEDFANDDDDAPLVEEPDVLVSSSRHEPIVFPDDVAPATEARRDGEPAVEKPRDTGPEPVAEVELAADALGVRERAAADANADEAAAAVAPEAEAEVEAEAEAETEAEAEVEAEAEADAEADIEADEAPVAGEPVVAIPRPAPPEQRVHEPVAEPEPAARQKQLFAAHVDKALVQEAIELVTSSRRASVAFLQRKLRIDYPLAADVLAELAARGVVALDGDASQGRVVG